MADIPTDQAPAAEPTRQRPNKLLLARLLPGALAALLFFALAAGDFLLGVVARPIQALLALLLAGAIMARPAVWHALLGLRAWAGLRHTAAVAGVAGLALFLRCWGLGFGLPYLEHPDEWAVADRALQMLRTADYSPHSFVYPTLYTYLQLGVAALHFLWGVGAGLYRTLDDIDPAQYYAWARALTALLGTAAVLCTYAVGRLLYGRAVGLLAAALLAVYPAATGDAHYVTTDTPAMFFTMLAFLVIALLYLRPPQRSRDHAALALIAGFGVGLAVATKYNVAVLVLPLLLALLPADHRTGEGERGREGEEDNGHATRNTQHATRNTFHVSRFTFHGSLALIGILLGFTLGTPMWLRELPQMLNDIASVLVHYKFAGHPGAESDHPALFYWDSFVANGALLAWAFLGGTLLAFVRRSRADLLVLSFAIPTFLQMISVKVVFFRNAMPLLPFLCLLVAALLVAGIGGLRLPNVGAQPAGFSQVIHTIRRNPLLLLLLAFILLAAQPLAQSIHDNWLRAQPTTRVLATEWVRRSAQDGTRIWLEDQTLILPARLRVQGGELVTTHDVEWYRAGGFRFLVVNQDVARDDGAQLGQFGAPAARFEPVGRHGPRLAIYDTGFGDPARDPRTPSGATLGAGAIVLDGYRHPAEARPGTTLPLALYWRATRSLPADYTVYVHLLDAGGGKAAQRDLPPLDGSLPTSRWLPDSLIRDDQDLALPQELPPGTYRLVAGMYDPQTLAAINDAGPIDLGEVIIR